MLSNLTYKEYFYIFMFSIFVSISYEMTDMFSHEFKYYNYFFKMV